MIRRLELGLGAALAALCLGLVLLASPFQARASDHDEPDFSRTGFYMGGGVTYATDLYEDELEDQLALGFDVDVDDTWGANARAGYRFWKFMALEVQYEWLDTYEIEVDNAGGDTDVDTQTITANLKLFLPIKRFQPYILGGAGVQRYELDASFFNNTVTFQQDNWEFAARVGAGFDIYLTEHLVFYAEGMAVLSEAEINPPAAVGFLDDVDNLFYAGAQGGLLWRF